MSTARAGGVRRRSWSLRTRLVVSAVALIAVVCAVIGAVTTLVLRSYLQGQVDDNLRAAVLRAERKHGQKQKEHQDPQGAGGLGFVAGPGQPIGTVGARLSAKGRVLEAVRVDDAPGGGSPGGDAASSDAPSGGSPGAGSPAAGTGSPAAGSGDGTGQLVPLGRAQRRALRSVPLDGRPHTVTLPGLGGYRAAGSLRGGFLLALPLREVRDTVDTLILVELCVAGAGLLAAGCAGAVVVGIALRPLRRVAATATSVSELPLHTGEVALSPRVPEAQADPRTEVGQVGAALNRMLGHVGSALAARQESETRVRQFVADASHELRTPLASIRGYAWLARRDEAELEPDTRHALGRVESESVRMTELVEDLLLLARLDSGRPLDIGEVDLSPLVVDAVSDARAADVSDHQWRLVLPDEPALVRGDRDRLHQVLVNLLANARTHTPSGTTVTARVVPDGAGQVTVEIGDDGPGIPPELLPRVFERFARGDASRSRAAAGTGSTGLGLAIVQAVVIAHGGRVDVASEPGRTVFTVRLPAA